MHLSCDEVLGLVEVGRKGPAAGEVRFDGLCHDLLRLLEHPPHLLAGAKVERGALHEAVGDVDGGAVLDEADGTLNAVGHDGVVQCSATIVGLSIHLRATVEEHLGWASR